MNEKLLKPYDPKNTEKRIYKLWEESGFFNPDNLPGKEDGQQKEAFTIMMPPPNATGTLHMGHALFLTLEDIMIRYKRMRGYKTLWLPGTDHASIATQSKVEKEIQKKEGLSRHDLGREKLLKRIDEFVEKNRDIMTSQMRTMGASCDWSREAFTLDDKRNLAVNTIFKKMYDDELIYRGNRIVNWDPKGQTTISDDEIVYEEREAKLYTFKYSHEFPIAISTTRPETKIGDTAVAVHPDDKRYEKFIGKEYDLKFCEVPIHIKIIADKEVDPEFGTGALGVTPAHSMIDWEMADRHDLPRPQVINEYAKMSIGGESLLGKKTTEARKIIVEWLRSQNLLEKEEEIKQNIATAERTGGTIEPLPKLQWFINVNKPIKERGNKTLKDLMREPFSKGEIKIIPDYFSKTYFHWIENLRDWCISRQIWYGHRIPVWYDSKGGVYCDTKAPVGENWKQDEDTLDTWFSSGLWTFSTLGWPASVSTTAGKPEKTGDLKTYHPTDVLETGYDILFFWVARMVLMSEYALGEVPFKNIFLHGTVRDAKGRKMSKSLNNGLDPIDIAEKFGADAGRMALIVGTAPGTDSKISEDKIKGYKNFANKIWNITRFILDNVDENNFGKTIENKLTKEFKEIKEDITTDMENYRFHLASEKIYQYIWHRFADQIIEETKEILKTNGEKADERRIALASIWKDCLKILHPFMPFVTEEIWQIINSRPESGSRHRSGLLMIGQWPS
ncbi:MAG: valine--tRNA ligase [Candidatus Pacebacteria bacterium]|nr:valine--tRNA ligase [Candidatus Paceibacterota bacterium]